MNAERVVRLQVVNFFLLLMCTPAFYQVEHWLQAPKSHRLRLAV